MNYTYFGGQIANAGTIGSNLYINEHAAVQLRYIYTAHMGLYPLEHYKSSWITADSRISLYPTVDGWQIILPSSGSIQDMQARRDILSDAGFSLSGRYEQPRKLLRVLYDVFDDSNYPISPQTRIINEWLTADRCWRLHRFIHSSTWFAKIHLEDTAWMYLPSSTLPSLQHGFPSRVAALRTIQAHYDEKVSRSSSKCVA